MQLSTKILYSINVSIINTNKLGIGPGDKALGYYKVQLVTKHRYFEVAWKIQHNMQCTHTYACTNVICI